MPLGGADRLTHGQVHCRPGQSSDFDRKPPRRRFGAGGAFFWLADSMGQAEFHCGKHDRHVPPGSQPIRFSGGMGAFLKLALHREFGFPQNFPE